MTNVFEFVSETFSHPAAQVISNFVAVQHSAEDTFGDLVNIAAVNACGTSDEFNAALLPGEIEVCQFVERSEPGSVSYRHKDGTLDARKGNNGWKVDKAIRALSGGSSSYSSAKSVIGKALDKGIALYVDGKSKGKSQLEKEIKNSKEASDIATDSTPKSEIEKARIVLGTLDKVYGKLTLEEQDTIRQEVYDMFNRHVVEDAA